MFSKHCLPHKPLIAPSRQLIITKFIIMSSAQFVSVSVLAELLAAEKEDTRLWLRAEMDRLIEPLLHSIFNRLETKLTNGMMNKNQSSDADNHAHVVNSNQNLQDQLANYELVNTNSQIQHQPLTFILEPSTSSHFDQFVNMDNTHLQPNGPIHLHSISNQHLSSQSVSIKDEIEATTNEQILVSQVQSCSAPVSNEQSNHNLTNQHLNNEHFNYHLHSSELNYSDGHLLNDDNQMIDADGQEMSDMDDDTALVDCNDVEVNITNQALSLASSAVDNEQFNSNLTDQHRNNEDECANGGIEVKEDEDYDDDVQVDEKSSRPIKRQRMNSSLDSTQPINAQLMAVKQASRQPPVTAQPNQVNIQDTKIITLGLQCPELACSQMFIQKPHYNMLDQFNDHMRFQHSIRFSRCLVKDCRQTFDNHQMLGSHINKSHANTTEWHCDKCSKHFAKYNRLSRHNTYYHQLGHYQCSFPACTFTGEYKQKVNSHYTQQHKDKPDLVCRQSACDYRTKDRNLFKEHARAHYPHQAQPM